MLKAAPATSKILAPCASLEMWGGATFDVALRCAPHRICPFIAFRVLHITRQVHAPTGIQWAANLRCLGRISTIESDGLMVSSNAREHWRGERNMPSKGSADNTLGGMPPQGRATSIKNVNRFHGWKAMQLFSKVVLE